MRLEVGKTYVTRDGDYVTIDDYEYGYGYYSYPYHGDNGHWYLVNGRAYTHRTSGDDLVDEVYPVEPQIHVILVF